VTANAIHVLFIVGTACFAGYTVNNREYGWATVLTLLDIALMFYK